MSRRIVIVGAGLAALRTLEALRAEGWSEEIHVYGDEKYMPYNRPPVSKKLLGEPVSHAAVAFAVKSMSEADRWVLGEPVTAIDLPGGRIRVGARLVDYDGMVVATGVSPRRLPVTSGRRDCHPLRTIEDAARVQAALVPGARVVVLGAGFIGCEAAASLVQRGVAVDVVAMDELPMMRTLGTLMGDEIRRRHESHGVRFHLGAQVDEITGPAGSPRVVLSNGTELSPTMIVEAVGSAPNVGMFDDEGLDVTDGLLCDNHLRVQGARRAVAVGDVARFPNPLFDDTARRVEHWQLPMFAAKRAARSLIEDLDDRPADDTPFTPMPWFWSDQYDTSIQSFGLPGIADEIMMLPDAPSGEMSAVYARAGRVTGVAHLGSARNAARLRGHVGADMNALAS